MIYIKWYMQKEHTQSSDDSLSVNSEMITKCD